ncbi:MAG TPA: hypothetical protein PKD70_13800 [Saprospiraceae bacterium]|nr:hypothetical protein [Saprospiraceae bacterium]HMP14946.1 hypothetical protein [Saprospiraceae bacterium]
MLYAQPVTPVKTTSFRMLKQTWFVLDTEVDLSELDPLTLYQMRPFELEQQVTRTFYNDGNYVMSVTHLRKTYEWWLTANDQYRVLIGELTPQSVVTGYTCQCTTYRAGEAVSTYSYPIGDPSDPSQCSDGYVSWIYSEECIPLPDLSIQFLAKESDGVVLAESAGSFPGAEHNEVMPKSNHQQMRNDQNTKEKLFRLFTGQLGSFFRTEER